MTKGTEWQIRLKAAGLTQKKLSDLLGMAENSVSRGLLGHWGPETPMELKFAIIAWEVMTPAQRDEVRRQLGIEWAQSQRRRRTDP